MLRMTSRIRRTSETVVVFVVVERSETVEFSQIDVVKIVDFHVFKS